MKKKFVIRLTIGLLIAVSCVIGYGISRSWILKNPKAVVSDAAIPVFESVPFAAQEEATEGGFGKEYSTKMEKIRQEKKRLQRKNREIQKLKLQQEKPKRTLMIYMLGSDLEARSKAGTDDLTEIQQSGMNLKHTDVLVYTGGSKKWHNDLVTSEENSILKLEAGGFQTVKTDSLVSMGSPESLAGFVNYVYENYPADQYALILWNHGNGPLIGYGKDMLFGNDSLTLSEMQTAMNQTPFGTGKKLSWVGFDACLMSSAELACIWGSYADYLVASQEVEPSFGWNYNVLKEYGSMEDTKFLSYLADGYMNTCLSYYEEHGYEHRDTTLSCLDLSYANHLEQNINNLFQKASKDVGTRYNLLAQRRVATRALGRASTGSEYDLIDLRDMAEHLQSVYPEETAALLETLEQMVVKNSTNASHTCGISLYYPFYNKFYYEDSWKAVYDNLGVFHSYGEYLDSYQEHWLSDDNLNQYQKSPVAQKVSEETNREGVALGNYKAHLTPEQSAAYADAKYYILEREKGDLYCPVYSSEQVIFEDGVLYADFQGKAIVVSNDFGSGMLPATIENDSVDHLGRYTLLAIGNMHQDRKDLQIQMTLDYETEEVNLSAVLSQTQQPDSRALTGGKREEYHLEDWDSYSFYYSRYQYLSRYDNQLVKPLSEWVDYGKFAYSDFPMRNGVYFSYEPLSGDDYYLIFEITDTQGNKYCSEPVAMTFEEFDNEPDYQMPKLTYDWNEGDRIQLCSQENVTVYLAKHLEKAVLSSETDRWGYRLEVENKNDFDVTVCLNNMTFNGTDIDMGELYVSANAAASEASVFTSKEENLFYAGVGGITEITSLEGTFYVQESVHYGYLVPKTQLKVGISGEAVLPESPFGATTFEIIGPYMKAQAEKQVLYQDEDIIVGLEGFGESNVSLKYGVLSVTNLSDKERSVLVDGLSINGMTLNVHKMFQVPPGRTVYDEFPSLLEMENNLITEIGSLSVHLGFYPGLDGVCDMPTVSQWVPVTLSQSGEKVGFSQKGTLLCEKDGVRIFLEGYYSDGKNQCWYLSAINDSDRDIILSSTDDRLWNCREKIGSHQRVRFSLSHVGYLFGNPLTQDSAQITFRVTDWYESQILWEAEEPNVLFVGNREYSDCMEIPWSDGDVCTVYNEQGIEISIEKYLYHGEWMFVQDGEYLYSVPYEEDIYRFVVKNNNPFAVDVNFDKILLNGDICYGNKINFYKLNPNEQRSIRFYSLEQFAMLEALERVTSIEGSLTVSRNDASKLKLLEDQNIKITMSGDASLNLKEHYRYQPLEVSPYLDAVAHEQLLWETDQIRISLLYLGNTEALNYQIAFCYENLTDAPLTVSADLLAFNGISTIDFAAKTVEPHSKLYERQSLNGTEGIVSSIYDAKIHFVVRSETSGFNTFKDSCWTTVNLSQKGIAEPLELPETLLFHENGVRIYLEGGILYQDASSGKTYPVWGIVVVNDNDDIIRLSRNYNYGNATVDSVKIGPRQMAYSVISQDNLLMNNIEDSGELRLKFELRDPDTYDLIYAAEEPTILSIDSDEHSTEQ